MFRLTFLLFFALPLTLSLGAEQPVSDIGDHPHFAHAMDIETRSIDDFPVVFHYGEVRPEFRAQSNNPLRDTQTLDGDWHFRFDPQNAGLTEKWHSGIADQNWQQVQVPHCWDMMPGGSFWDWSDWSPANPPFYNGAAWYRRDFEFQPLDKPSHRLQFLGVQQRARIFLNGTLLALHEGGGQPFSLTITDKLKVGKNTLALQVIRLPNYLKKEDGGFQEIDNTHTQHPKAPDNWPYAGLTRSVSLQSESHTTIRKAQVRIRENKLEVAVCLSSTQLSKEPYLIKLSSPALEEPVEHSFTFDGKKNRVQILTVPLKPNAKSWSPESPHLYTLDTRLSQEGTDFDLLQTTFGIRDFKTVGSSFELNGQDIFLKGVAFYEEHPSRGSALRPEDHEKLFALTQDARANFARLHLSQRHPYVYELADQLGVLLCAEWGGFWYKEKSMAAQSEDSQSIYQSHARCAIWDLMNHPSIVLWGLNNECHQFCPEYETFVKTSRELAHSLDWHRRPLTWAAWHPHQGQPQFEYADAVGFNEYRGAMDPFEDLAPDLQKVIANHPEKPLIIMENGAWSTLGRRGSVDRKGTEDWQADLMRRQHEVLSQFAPLSGYTYWLLQDYRSRKEYTGNKRQGGWSKMGLYSAQGEPKLVRDVFKELSWKTEPSLEEGR